MNIRKAEPQDALTLSTLCTDVQRLHADHHPEIFKPPASLDFAETFFANQLQDPNTHIFIAEQDGVAVGYIFCKLTKRSASVFKHESCFLHIDQISVAPEKQRHGAGATLMARACTLAKELGVKRIQLDTWDFNLKAHSFFEHEGFTKFMYHYWLNLE